MLSQNEIYLLMRMIERTYQCRICIIDGDANPFFSACFPEIDTAHLSEFCKPYNKNGGENCRDCDDLVSGQHGKGTKTAFYKVCSYGCMEIVGTVAVPGLQPFQLFAGAFKPRADLPENALIYPLKQSRPSSENLRELSDVEFAELPVLWDMLIREITLFFEKKAAENVANLDPKEVVSDYVNGSFRKNISLSDLAAKLGWSNSHTTVRVRQLFGKTFIQMLNERRVENAKWLLRNRYRMPISYIAKVSGFRSTPYFFRIFSRLAGMTPVEYRNSTKNE